MAVDNEMICIMFTPSNVCYLCVEEDVASVMATVSFSSLHRMSRTTLENFWDRNFTQNIGISHVLILLVPSKINALKQLVMPQ